MTLHDLVNALETLGLPIAYGQFEATEENPPPAPPFMCYLETEPADVKADNINYAKVRGYRIELYTDAKDPVREKAIEDLLDSQGLAYRKWEAWIEEEKLQEAAYEVQLV